MESVHRPPGDVPRAEKFLSEITGEQSMKETEEDPRVSVLSCIYFHPEITGFFKDPWDDGAALIGLHHLRP